MGVGALSLWPNFQKEEGEGGGLTGSQILEGVTGKEGGDFFQGGLQFFHKKYTKIWNI